MIHTYDRDRAREQAAELLRAMAAACERRQDVWGADVYMNTPHDGPATLEINIEIEADHELFEAANDYITEVHGV